MLATKKQAVSVVEPPDHPVLSSDNYEEDVAKIQKFVRERVNPKRIRKLMKATYKQRRACITQDMLSIA